MTNTERPATDAPRIAAELNAWIVRNDARQLRIVRTIVIGVLALVAFAGLAALAGGPVEAVQLVLDLFRNAWAWVTSTMATIWDAVRGA